MPVSYTQLYHAHTGQMAPLGGAPMRAAMLSASQLYARTVFGSDTELSAGLQRYTPSYRITDHTLTGCIVQSIILHLLGIA